MHPQSEQTYLRVLQKRLAETPIPFCLGIDLHLFCNLPHFFSVKVQKMSINNFINDFCTCLFEAMDNNLNVIKWQSAFFEACGWSGIKALEEMTLKAHQKGILNIYDAKRSDIQSTMSAYGKAAFDVFHADAMTLTPYLGTDTMAALEPWLRNGKGIYLVLLSSNHSGKDIQTQKTVGMQSFAEFTASKFVNVAQEGGYLESLGFVVGAPYFSDQSRENISYLVNFPLLIPGVGAQGYSLQDIKKSLPHHSPYLINVSRDILGIGSQEHTADLEKISSWSGYQNWVRARIAAYKEDWLELSP